LKSRFTKPEEIVIQEEQEAHAMFFLADGVCSVEVTDENKDPKHVRELSKGAHFGEVSLVYNTKRTATVMSDTYCNIAEVSSKDFYQILNHFPSLKMRMRKFTSVYNDVWKEYLLSILGQIEYLNELPEDSFRELVYYMIPEKFEPNEYIFCPGDKITKIFLVTEGKVEISATINSPDLQMVRIGSGQT
jgi:CRP-like cAMP-binding protein